jgi:hypothetical protein
MWQRIKDIISNLGKSREYKVHTEYIDHTEYDAYGDTHTDHCITIHTHIDDSDDDIACVYDINDYDDVDDELTEQYNNLLHADITHAKLDTDTRTRRRTPWYRVGRASHKPTTTGLIARDYLGICRHLGHHNYITLRSVAPLTEWECQTCGESTTLRLLNTRDRRRFF